MCLQKERKEGRHTINEEVRSNSGKLSSLGGWRTRSGGPGDDVEASAGLRQHEFHDFADNALSDLWFEMGDYSLYDPDIRRK